MRVLMSFCIFCTLVLLCVFNISVMIPYMTKKTNPLPESNQVNKSTMFQNDGRTREYLDSLVLGAELKRGRLTIPGPQTATQYRLVNKQETMLKGRESPTTKSEHEAQRRAEGEITRQRSSSTRTNLLILSQGRGGSTLLGELFNNHPDVMYVFEPLHAVGTIFNVNVYYDKEPRNYGDFCNKVLDGFFKCNFSKISRVLPKLSTTAFRLKSKALTGDLFCKERQFKEDSKEDLRSSSKCATLTNVLLGKACHSYKHTVVKILSLRLHNQTIESFRDQLEHQSEYDVKFINLIRDPRAVVYSWVTTEWIKNHTDPGFRLDVHKICQPIEKNLRLGLSSPAWLKDRFKVILYEDLVANTIEVARQLYSFAGFDWSPNVAEWIEEHQGKPSRKEEKDPYSTYKNASVVLNKWKEAPEALIRVVEDVCGDLMDLVGYKRWKKGEKS